MKRYSLNAIAIPPKTLTGAIVDHWEYKYIEDSFNGEWVKWEDVKELIGFEYHDEGYIRLRNIATRMDISLHQRFFANAATLRFKTENGKPIIIDIEMNAFEDFMESYSANKGKELIMNNPKPQTYRSDEYRDFIRTKPCAKCGSMHDIVAHHESLNMTGMGMKPPDSHAVPLCMDCHNRRHAFGVNTFWDPYDVKMLIIRYLTEYLQMKGV